MNNYSTENWQYLTTENESGDYHHVYEMMSQVLDGQWIAVYVDGGYNPNFKTYILTGKAHHTQIADVDQNTQTEIIETI